jgi:hypothetical protein
MPWKETDVMTEKERFVILAQTGRFTISERPLCEARAKKEAYLRRQTKQLGFVLTPADGAVS